MNFAFCAIVRRVLAAFVGVGVGEDMVRSSGGSDVSKERILMIEIVSSVGFVAQ